MLKTDDFFAVDLYDNENETRLTLLYKEIAQQHSEDKRRLVDEFIRTIADTKAKIHRRILARLIIGNHCQDLNIKGSAEISQRLGVILRTEFIVSSKTGYMFRGGKTQLRELDDLNRVLFELLVLALVRINFTKSSRLVLRIVEMIPDLSFKRKLFGLIESEKLTS
jgi:hypothetical protein